MRTYALCAKNLVFFATVILLPELSPGQVLALFPKSRPVKSAGTQNQGSRPLYLVLTEMAKRYKVKFNYDPDLIGSQMVSVEKSSLNNPDPEVVLNQILKPLDLSFEKVQKNDYIIFPDKKRTKESDSKSQLNLIEGIHIESSLATTTIQANPATTRAITLSTVSGTVTSGDTGEPLPGVSVSLKGTTQGAITDKDGKYSLNIPSGQENGILVFSSIGYLSEEIPLNNNTIIDIKLATDVKSLGEVVVIGYGTQKKESVTGAISSVTSKDLEHVHGSTVSATLAGKIPGASFRMADGRPGAWATVQVRNLGDPLYVIDGIQKDAGQFNNLSPNDIESMTVLKDASASVYGSRAANGVVIVTTKRGKAGSSNTINVDAYYGWQNWTRFPKTVNAAEWMTGKVEADINGSVFHTTDITPEELAKWQAGTEKGYQSFDWYKFIVKPNAPQSSININATGGSDKINYYLSLTRLDQSSVLGREFTFARTNIQSNIDAKISNRFKVGVQINGRIETRDQPGVPGSDDYWAPRFALFRNRPTERPYANDNPKYVADIGHNDTNWGIMNKAISGYWREDWRVLQSNFTGEYQLPLKGLVAKGMYSYYIADKVMNGHEYTYDAYTYDAQKDEYIRTGGSTNPWRERGVNKVLEKVVQGQLLYNNTFGKHTVGGTFVVERIERNELESWVHSVPQTNALPILQFSDMDTYDDKDEVQARIGYVGRFTYNYADKYFLEIAGRRDASWKFAPTKRWGVFPSVSAGWRISEEGFFKNLDWNVLSDLKLRASYGELGDDNINMGINADDRRFIRYPMYIPGYRYATSRVILDGQVVTGARDKGVPITNLSWFTSKITDIGLDYAFLNGRITGAVDYFYRKRTGLRERKYDILVPSEIGYSLPEENVNTDAQIGGEISALYSGKINQVTFSVGGNISYSRSRAISSYKPRFGNSWDRYRGSNEDRWSGTYWGYEVIGQFQSQAQINDYDVNIDGEGNKTLLPGDLIYKDVNGDGVINGDDERPIGYARDKNPIVNYGLSLSAAWKGFDLRADFSGGTMYSYNRQYEMRVAYQNTGNLLKELYDDRWHRADPYNIDSEWIPGKYPALRFNDGRHSNYRNSTFWLTNVKYLRLRTMEIGYSIPKALTDKIKIQRARIYVNTYNLFSIDNVRHLGVDPEIMDENGLQYPQSKLVNIGVNLSF
ncbi:TonB-dependent receptor [Cytophagaceae bacterium DM2B3-1]|uniref:TonB-dependent receptor n=1 Tax=Xanthocytophaga flava TaxID=3048013 RepID=A0ABT7CNR6_9BACT|nr:TonB-dependent receptor [Xanthocytophaga flavus]MDJ1495325.1 TonB-dependent receptor [Xanthocytophaga flavus]